MAGGEGAFSAISKFSLGEVEGWRCDPARLGEVWRRRKARALDGFLNVLNLLALETEIESIATIQADMRTR